MQYIRMFFIVALVAMWMSITSFTASSQTPTPQWIFFYSLELEFDGVPVSGGTVIQAFVSRTGQQCGSQAVASSGALPLLTCYMADPATGTDGVLGGDVIYFVVGGVQAVETYQLPATIFNGQRFELKRLTSKALSLQSCIDGYESDDSRSTASAITGPEARTFFNKKHGWDQDWAKFNAKHNWTYQIKARSFQPFSITHPVLRLYDTDGNLLAENQMDKWGRGAEIWWWNDDSERTIYIQVTEAEGRYGCRHYTLTLHPWSPAEMQLRFGR